MDRDPQQVKEYERPALEDAEQSLVCPVHQAPIVADLMRGRAAIQPLCITCVVERTYDKSRSKGEVQLRLL